jgi:TetR/AcrR family transcriptional regulator
MDMVPERSHRRAAEERRADILAAAITEFSEKGFHGGSTVTIAQRAGISQPNLFRLFPTKKALFITALETVVLRIQRTMIAAGRNHPEDPLHVMRQAYRSLLSDRELMLLLLQGYAASEDQEIRQVMRHSSAEVFAQIEEMPGFSTEQARAFFAEGILLAAAAAMNLAEIEASEAWARTLLFLS